MNTRLIDHRQALTNNKEAYIYEFEDDNIIRLVGTIVPHLQEAGYKVSKKKSEVTLSKIIKLLFKAQDNRPIFHVEGTELPLCWNAPKDWDKDYIKYEWGHLRSKNQAKSNAYDLENIGLYSARCNQHIQTSMHIEELMLYGGILAQRISNVLTNRRKLFESLEWKNLIQELEKKT